jgi:hypothetical protein
MTNPFFYQSIDLPNGEFQRGLWDHRNTVDVYLGRTDFAGKTVIDIGPASGFWSFEMERRGASVTAIDLGDDDKWDIVPHGGKASEYVAQGMQTGVRSVRESFWYSHAKLGSRVQMKRGTAYNVPALVDNVDIAMMGNILQHLRDPFLAIERVASVVTERIIISESLWIEDPAFLATAAMRLIPREETPDVHHSWFQVTPPLIGEIIKILGFKGLRCELHEQRFMGTDIDPHPRMVKHFTYVGNR